MKTFHAALMTTPPLVRVPPRVWFRSPSPKVNQGVWMASLWEELLAAARSAEGDRRALGVTQAARGNVSLDRLRYIVLYHLAAGHFL